MQENSQNVGQKVRNSTEGLLKKNPHFGIASWFSRMFTPIMKLMTIIDKGFAFIKEKLFPVSHKKEQGAGHIGDFESNRRTMSDRIIKKAENLLTQKEMTEAELAALNESCIIKWVDKKELESFKQVKENQDKGSCLSIFPKIYGAVEYAQDKETWLSRILKKVGVIKPTDRNMHPNKAGFIIMQKVASNHIDIKLGFKTVTTQDESTTPLKKLRSTTMDSFYRSKERGFRIETRKSRSLNSKLDIDFKTLFGENPKLYASIIKTIDKIIKEFKSGNYKDKTFIASSLLISVSKDKSSCDARLIDLAHPLERTTFKKRDFEPYKNNFLFGLENLKTQLENCKENCKEKPTTVKTQTAASNFEPIINGSKVNSTIPLNSVVHPRLSFSQRARRDTINNMIRAQKRIPRDFCKNKISTANTLSHH